MPNLSSDGSNQFLNSFMLGFGVVDQANSSRRRDRMLQQRLDDERADREFRQGVIKEQRGFVREDRAFTQTERSRIESLREAENRARNLISDPNAPIADLEALDDDVEGRIPFLTDEIRRRRTDEQQFGDFNSLFQGIGDQAQATQQPSDQALVDEDPSFQGQVEAAALPADQGPQEPVSPADLRALSLSDPASAAAIRDEQNQPLMETVTRDLGQGRTVTERVPSAAGKAKAAKETKAQEVATYWGSFNNIEDAAGDAARTLSPELATAKYFDDRSTLDADQQLLADQAMQPRINATIQSQNAILATSPPDSVDVRNANRKLREANGLAHTIATGYNPGQAAGVNGRGMLVGNNAISEAAGVAMTTGSPGAPPGGFTQSETKAATAVVKAIKPGTTRFNEAQMRSMYRLYRDGKLTTNDIDSLRRTGQLPRPPGEYQTLNTGDGSQALYYLDGVGGATLVAEGGKGANSNRITLTDDGLKEASKAFEQFGDNAAAFRNEFVASLFDARDQIQTRGFDLERPEDVGRLSQLFAQGVIIREDYNDEFYEDGEFFPDYTANYGTIWESILNPVNRDGVQRFVTKENSGIFGDDLQLGSVPPQQTGGADVDYARGVLAEMGHPAANSATPQEAVQLVVELLTQQQQGQ